MLGNQDYTRTDCFITYCFFTVTAVIRTRLCYVYPYIACFVGSVSEKMADAE
jgi:hypothetical protein